MRAMDSFDAERLRPSVQTLLAAVPDRADRLAAVAETMRGWDAATWDLLVLCASHHGVLGAIHHALLEHADVPTQARDAIARRVAIDALWQEHLRGGLESAAAVLAASGVPVCALKGPVLAERFYGQGMTRHCLDIDFLVGPEAFQTARSALVAAGYTPEGGATAEYLARHSHAIGFSRPDTAPVEIHFRTYVGFGVVLPAALLLDRSRPYRFGDTELRVPSPEEEFIYLATHAAGHSFIRLVWLYDLKLLTLCHRDLDWTMVAAKAVEHGVVAPVVYAIRLLERWFDLSIDGLPATLTRRTLRARAADRLLSEVSRPQPVSIRDNLGGLIFTALLCDRLSSGIWMLQHHVGRSARRKMKALAPGLLPERWSA